MTNRRPGFLSIQTAHGAQAVALAVLLVAAVAGAQSPEAEKGAEAAERGAERSEREAARADATASRDDIIRFVPPNRGRARRSAAGGTRGVDSSAVSRIRVAIVAPAEGLTTRAQPVLYWYLSRHTDARIDVVVTAYDAIDPLLEVTLPSPTAAGIHAVDLAEYDVSLEPGRIYRWSVAVVQDEARRSNDIMTEGVIERARPSAELSSTLEEASRRFAPYARAGIWYDALAELRTARVASPEDPALRKQEVALLEQIELHEVARYARTEAHQAGTEAR